MSRPDSQDPRSRRLRLAVLLSGGGRTLQNLAEAIDGGQLCARIDLVVSSHHDAFGLERARRLGLPHRLVDYRDYRADSGAFSRAITETVDSVKPDLVVMAGFIRRWDFPGRYRHRVMNIHPALLPAFGGKGFYGSRVHRAVLEAGVKFSGCTVHFATGKYDDGPIIVQRIVPVLDDDTPQTLASRVFEEECVAYPEALRLYSEDRLEIRDGRVRVLPPREEASAGSR